MLMGGVVPAKCDEIFKDRASQGTKKKPKEMVAEKPAKRKERSLSRSRSLRSEKKRDAKTHKREKSTAGKTETEDGKPQGVSSSPKLLKGMGVKPEQHETPPQQHSDVESLFADSPAAPVEPVTPFLVVCDEGSWLVDSAAGKMILLPKKEEWKVAKDVAKDVWVVTCVTSSKHAPHTVEKLMQSQRAVAYDEKSIKEKLDKKAERARIAKEAADKAAEKEAAIQAAAKAEADKAAAEKEAADNAAAEAASKAAEKEAADKAAAEAAAAKEAADKAAAEKEAADKAAAEKEAADKAAAEKEAAEIAAAVENAAKAEADAKKIAQETADKAAAAAAAGDLKKTDPSEPSNKKTDKKKKAGRCGGVGAFSSSASRFCSFTEDVCDGRSHRGSTLFCSTRRSEGL